MALTVSFTVSQSTALPSTISLTDTSTGSDGTITQRRVLLRKADGTYLVPEGTTTDYIEWDWAEPSIAIDVMDRDYALDIIVQWLNVSNQVVYTDTELCVFTLYAEQFYYQLTQYQTSNPQIIDDQTYYGNKIKLRVSIDEATNAVTIGADITSSQSALDRAAYLIDNQSLFF
jgi:hypothetical protein